MVDEGFVLMPEARPAIVKVRTPVHDDDGYVTHYEMVEYVCAVHTVQSGKGAGSASARTARSPSSPTRM